MIKKTIIALLLVNSIAIASEQNTISIICGPMYSGKTKMLIDDINQFQILNETTQIPIIVSYEGYTRDGEKTIKSRAYENKINATFSFGNNDSFLEKLQTNYINETAKHLSINQSQLDFSKAIKLANANNFSFKIFIDEFQFMNSAEIVDLKTFIEATHIDVNLYGLNYDFQRNFFESYNQVISLFNPRIQKLTARCAICDSPNAEFTGRFTADGKFCTEGETFVIEGTTPELYFPLCTSCFGKDL